MAGAGEIDVLVSNAGEIFYSSVEEIPIDRYRELFELNTIGALRIAQAVLPQMRERGDGRLLFQSSVVGRTVRPPECVRVDQVGAGGARRGPGDRDRAARARRRPAGARRGQLGRARRRHPLRAARRPVRVLYGGDGIPARAFISVEQAAAEIADAVEADPLPLRIPIGDPARQILAARRAAPDDVPCSGLALTP